MNLLRTGLLLALLTFTACQPLALPAGTLPPSPTAPADPNLVEIGGRRMWLSCVGEGPRTVILEAGLGADHTAWERVQPDAAQLTRVCSYDRAGLGRSNPAATPRTGADVVADLHALLQAAEITPPYVLVGHSFGALFVRLYAYTYPEEVAGLVLVDPVHEDWWTKAAIMLPPAAANEAAELADLRGYFASEGGAATENAEGIDIAASAAELRAARQRGNLPLIVLSAGIVDVVPSGLPAEWQAPLTTLFQEELPADLVTDSPNSMRLTVTNSGHNIPATQPAVILAAIKTLVELP